MGGLQELVLFPRQAISTWDAAAGIEQCRHACGGNGFLQSSGLPRLLTYYLQNITWDGENNVMALQTARYLLKCLKVRGSLPPPLPSPAELLFAPRPTPPPPNGTVSNRTSLLLPSLVFLRTFSNGPPSRLTCPSPICISAACWYRPLALYRRGAARAKPFTAALPTLRST